MDDTSQQTRHVCIVYYTLSVTNQHIDLVEGRQKLNATPAIINEEEIVDYIALCNNPKEENMNNCHTNVHKMPDKRT